MSKKIIDKPFLGTIVCICTICCNPKILLTNREKLRVKKHLRRQIMNKLKIAIPTDGSGGLQGKRSGHFGHCQQFTLVEIDNNELTAVSYLDNPPHPTGGCMQPVILLKENQVDSIIVGGMGANPFNRFAEAGISVFFADRTQFPDVQSAINSLLAGLLVPMDSQQVCGGGGDCHQHHGTP
jgi:predicted Fe-Mo cluster-binding NifX family protein